MSGRTGTRPVRTLLIMLVETPLAMASFAIPSGPFSKTHSSITMRLTVFFISAYNLALVTDQCKHFLSLQLGRYVNDASKMENVEKTDFFSLNLTRLMSEAGLTQEALAAKADVGYHTIFRAVSKGTIPRGPNIAKIAQALGVTVADLWKDPNAKPPHASDNPKLSDLAGKQDKILALLERQEAASNEHSEEIQHLIQCWKDAPDERNRAVFLYFLTGDDRELDRAGKAFRKEAAAYFRHLGLKKSKGRVSSL